MQPDTPPRPDVRRATPADIPLIRALAAEAFPATYRDILAPEQIDYMMEYMYSEASLAGQMAEGHVFLIPSLDGEPCGYLSVEQQATDLFHLQKIYLLPRFRGRGIGAMLFRCAVEHVRTCCPRACRLELNVNRHNSAAVRFYERMGMHRLRDGDFAIGNGYFMNDHIMGMELGEELTRCL